MTLELLLRCSNTACERSAARCDGSLTPCSRGCRRAFYCSRTCEDLHALDGHGIACRQWASALAAAAAASAAPQRKRCRVQPQPERWQRRRSASSSSSGGGTPLDSSDDTSSSGSGAPQAPLRVSRADALCLGESDGVAGQGPAAAATAASVDDAVKGGAAGAAAATALEPGDACTAVVSAWVRRWVGGGSEAVDEGAPPL